MAATSASAFLMMSHFLAGVRRSRVENDTPLTVEHEMQVLRQAGFADVRILKEWGTTFTLLAKR